MKYYTYILKFENENSPMSAENGIPLEDFARIIMALGKIFQGNVFVSDIISASYGIAIAAQNEPEMQKMEKLHEQFADKNIEGLTKPEKDYFQAVSDTLEKYEGLTLQGKPEKGQTVKIEPFKIRKKATYYNEITSLQGIITGIGGKTLNGKSIIHLANIPYDIEISASQERALKPYLKQAKMLLTINKKINIEDTKVVKAVLEDFNVIAEDYKIIEKGQFFRKLKDIRDKYGSQLDEEFSEEKLYNE